MKGREKYVMIHRQWKEREKHPRKPPAEPFIMRGRRALTAREREGERTRGYRRRGEGDGDGDGG